MAVGRWNRLAQQKTGVSLGCSNGPLMVDAKHYGRWGALLFDHERLTFEAGLGPATLADGAGTAATRAVDMAEHMSDVALWSALFNFAQRRDGSAGARAVWQEVVERGAVRQVDGVVATAFWGAVLGAALQSAIEEGDGGAFLESTWVYAAWLLEAHGVRWPDYYRTVVAHLLGARQCDEALRWHVRLSGPFGVGKAAFFELLGAFLEKESDSELQWTLMAVYVTSQHRGLYDTVVPLLWSRGQSALARAWRETMVRHGDRPSATASRPFIQFLAGYYPTTELCAEEAVLVRTQSPQYVAPAVDEATTTTAPALQTNVFHLLNRVHGETFGVADQSAMFNDKVGSHWFATTWVSLDTAIHLLYTLGVASIGPLSLQMIALREHSDPAALARRIDQLARYGIGLGRSSFSRALRHLAATRDAVTLAELLQATTRGGRDDTAHVRLAPAVFDDHVQQRLIRSAAAIRGDLSTLRLLLTVRLAVDADTLVSTANQLLRVAVERRRWRWRQWRWRGTAPTTALKLLDELAACRIPLQPATSASLAQHIIDDVPRVFRPQDPPDIDFYAALARRLLYLRQPVPAEAWQNMLYSLGRQGRLDALEALALDLVDCYDALQGSAGLVSDETAAFKVHVADVPAVVRGDGRRRAHARNDDYDTEPDGAIAVADLPTADIGYRLLPRDLPRDHPLHPLSLVFDAALIHAFVRWFFYRRSAFRGAGRGRGAHGDFGLAGGIWLLARLRDRGVAITATDVRAATLMCIAALYGPPAQATRYWQPARAANQLTLAEVQGLCNAAWVYEHEGATYSDKHGDGHEVLLPPAADLAAAITALLPSVIPAQ